PTVQVRDLEFAPYTGILAAGTYGRGVWEILSATPQQSIGGTAYNDLNGNGSRDGGEPGLANWRVYLDQNNNGQYDPALTGPTTYNSTNVPVTIPANFTAVSSTLT